MFAIAGIECEPLLEGFSEGCNDSGPYARVPYLVGWDQRWDLVRAVKGVSSTTGPNGPWNRTGPMPYPDPVMGATIYAKDIEIKPEGRPYTPSDPIRMTAAIVTVSFGTLTWAANIGDDPLFLNSFSQDPGENESLQYATQELDFGAEWINIPNSSCGFSDGTKLDTPVSRRMSVYRMHITWHRYPLLPMIRIRDYADTVNDATFLGCERGTVYFEGVKTVRETAADGTMTQKVSMTLKWRKHDWNEVLRPDDGQFDFLIYDGDSSSSTYKYKNFRNLLL